MADGTGLFDALAGAAGHPINRPGLEQFVANSQAQNGLRSAQTEDALIKAQQAREEMDAGSQLEQAYTNMQGPDGKPLMAPSAAKAAALISRAHFGNAKEAMEALGQAQQNNNRGILSDVSQLGQPSQTAAQQGVQGKVAEPVALPDNFTTLPGAAPINAQQSAQGIAHLAQTQALTSKDVADAEEAHAKAKQTTSPASSLDPGALDGAAQVVMADPTKMSQYSGFGKQGQGNKDAINNRIAQQLNAAGMSATDMIRQRAIAHANIGGATQAAKQAQTLDAFTPLVKSNSDRIMQLLDTIGDDGGDMPILAGYQRALGRNLGSDDLAELHSVFTTYQAEVARLLAAGPSMNGVISDKSRADIQGMAPENMTTSQARRVVNRVNTEISIRRQGVQSSLDSAAGAQLPVTAGPQTPASQPAGPQTPAMSLDDYLKSKGH